MHDCCIDCDSPRIRPEYGSTRSTPELAPSSSSAARSNHPICRAHVLVHVMLLQGSKVLKDHKFPRRPLLYSSNLCPQASRRTSAAGSQYAMPRTSLTEEASLQWRSFEQMPPAKTQKNNSLIASSPDSGLRDSAGPVTVAALPAPTSRALHPASFPELPEQFAHQLKGSASSRRELCKFEVPTAR